MPVSIHSNTANNHQATEPIQTLDHLPFGLLMGHRQRSLSMHRLPPPTIRGRRTAMTTSRNLQKSRTGVREVYRLHQQLAPGTLLSVHASNSTMHGRLTITTAEETLRHATGSHPCLHNRSKKSSTLSRWYASLCSTY